MSDALNPYTRYRITIEKPIIHPTNTPARMKRAQRASTRTTLVKALLKRRGL